jgi:hypothetical protein
MFRHELRYANPYKKNPAMNAVGNSSFELGRNRWDRLRWRSTSS